MSAVVSFDLSGPIRSITQHDYTRNISVGGSDARSTDTDVVWHRHQHELDTMLRPILSLVSAFEAEIVALHPMGGSIMFGAASLQRFRSQGGSQGEEATHILVRTATDFAHRMFARLGSAKVHGETPSVKCGVGIGATLQACVGGVDGRWHVVNYGDAFTQADIALSVAGGQEMALSPEAVTALDEGATGWVVDYVSARMVRRDGHGIFMLNAPRPAERRLRNGGLVMQQAGSRSEHEPAAVSQVPRSAAGGHAGDSTVVQFASVPQAPGQVVSESPDEANVDVLSLSDRSPSPTDPVVELYDSLPY
jgi:hypothetical protein